MRKPVFVVISILVLGFTGACGGGDGDGDADASPPDGGASIDAAPAAVVGLGESCTMPTDCPTGAPICAVVGGGAVGICTLQCGTSPDPGPGGQPTKPEGSDAVCTGAYTGSVPLQGTPSCALTAAPQGGQVPWACAIQCGPITDGDLGGCPPGFTCSQNFCNPS